MKNIAAFLFSILLILCFAGCANSKPDNQNSAESVQIPNPFTDCDTLEQAQEIAGFSIVLPPSLPEGYEQTAIRAMQDSMLEIIYEDGENEIRVRKAAGSDDISGDYTEYKEISTIAVGEKQVSVKGNDGKIFVATWTDDTFSYSITASGGLDSETISGLIGAI